MSGDAAERHESVMTLLWLGGVGQPPMVVTRTVKDSLFASVSELALLDRNGNVITRFTQAGDAERVLDAIVATFPSLRRDPADHTIAAP